MCVGGSKDLEPRTPLGARNNGTPFAGPLRHGAAAEIAFGGRHTRTESSPGRIFANIFGTGVRSVYQRLCRERRAFEMDWERGSTDGLDHLGFRERRRQRIRW
jgi:hypothetical protein